MSEAFYSLDAYMRKDVMCLGGPNFDPLSITDDNLRKLGYSTDEIVLIQKSSCHVMFTDAHIANIPGSNLTWSLAGFSGILKTQTFYFTRELY